MRKFTEQKDLRSLSFGIIAGAVIIVVLMLILPIDIVYKVPVQAKVYPAQEWKLVGAGGEYNTESISFDARYTPIPERTFVFDRGDIVEMVFPSSIKEGGRIQQDSTLLTFTSQRLNLQIQQVLNRRDINLAQIKAGNAAMKAPLFESAREQAELAKANLELQSLNLERIEKLYQDSVVSRFEYDNQLTAFRIADQEFKVATRNLENTTFEIKPEDVDVFAMGVETSENELEILLQQLEAFEIKAPFDGTVNMHPEDGTVLSVRDLTSHSLVFPVPLDEYKRMKGQSRFYLADQDSVLLDFSLQGSAGELNGAQFVLGVAQAPDQDRVLGELSSAYIVCDTISLREYLFRKLN